ncbi:MAG: MSMEG_0565 family glycosyltransferase [Candidatus Neomarinimicrobiota bacterium]|nr:MSMEG_0565 family glycosyltransferase [Candidatus Neomarinimicrobiota bacterium]
MDGNNRRPLRIAFFTYSTRPRGGVVHTLALAEHIQDLGHDVHIFALGKDEKGFFRPSSVPSTFIPCASGKKDEPLDDRIQRYIDTYSQFLVDHLETCFDIYHSQDCVSANGLWHASEKGLISSFIRTIHHVDDFANPRLIQCQKDSIYRPQHRLVVSQYWKERLTLEFGVDSHIIHNGVDMNRFLPPTHLQRKIAREKLDVSKRTVFLNIGGIEPRKNSIRLVMAFCLAKRQLLKQGLDPVLLIAGGETLFDYTPYRTRFFDWLHDSELEIGKDIVLLEVVKDEQIPVLYHAADSLLFPSVKEGWGLVVLEAMASGVPVLTSDIPVFREYLRHEENAIMVNAKDESSIASGIKKLATDAELKQRLASSGPNTAGQYTWQATARAHLEQYYKLLSVESKPAVGEEVKS